MTSGQCISGRTGVAHASRATRRGCAQAPAPVGSWYSQLNLVHGLTVRAGPGDGAPELIRPYMGKEWQPFVRAAGMCKRALDRRAKGADADVTTYVWDDEGVVVSRRPGGLARVAIQLVGDITVLLNLNETDRQPPASVRTSARSTCWPYCMEGSRTRMELFDERIGCRCDYTPG